MIIEGTFVQCQVCYAFVTNKPRGIWHTVDLIKVGSENDPVVTYLTPHSLACDAPLAQPLTGISIRVSGDLVEDGVSLRMPV